MKYKESILTWKLWWWHTRPETIILMFYIKIINDYETSSNVFKIGNFSI